MMTNLYRLILMIKQLRKAGRQINKSFQLGNEIYCQTLLRVIPGKRAVFLGKWKQKQIIAKLYYHHWQARRGSQREVKGLNTLTRAGINTVRVLYKDKINGIEVVLLNYIAPSFSLEDLWVSDQNSDQKIILLQKLMLMLADMHNVGIQQRDLHLNNFLLKDNTIIAIDGAAVSQIRGERPLAIKPSLNNLAPLFARLNFKEADIEKHIFAEYLQRRNWNDMEQLYPYLTLCTTKYKEQFITKRLHKIFREHTQGVCIKTWKQLSLCRKKYHTTAMQTFLNNPDQIFQEQNSIFLKQGNSSTVVRARIGDREFVIKRYNIKNWTHGLRRAFKTTRAAVSWRGAHHLKALDIATPAPVAMVEKRWGPLTGTAYFICEFVSGPHALEFFQQNNSPSLRNCSNIAARIVNIFRQLDTAGLSHGDMKATNIIIHAQLPYLIDLDGLHKHIFFYNHNHAYQKDIHRFLQNWKNSPAVLTMFTKLLQA